MSEDLVVLSYEGPVANRLYLGRLILTLPLNLDLVIHEWGNWSAVADLYVKTDWDNLLYGKLHNSLHLSRQRPIAGVGLPYGMQWYVMRGTAESCIHEVHQLFPNRNIRVIEAIQ